MTTNPTADEAAITARLLPIINAWVTAQPEDVQQALGEGVLTTHLVIDRDAGLIAIDVGTLSEHGLRHHMRIDGARAGLHLVAGELVYVMAEP